MTYWQPEFELMDRAELEDLQLKRLKSTVEKVYKNVPFYHERMLAAGISPQDIQSLKDLNRLPTTRKANLRENYP
ncbi:MAG: phenylacetate--CoA ligase, partial [Methanotrichaceae archaeon]